MESWKDSGFFFAKQKKKMNRVQGSTDFARRMVYDRFCHPGERPDQEETMIIYAEDLFLENFLTGLLLLSLTGQLAGQELPSCRKTGRLLAGGAACGVCGFLIFLPLHPAAGLAVRGLLSAAVTALALGRRKLLRKTLLFLLLTFLTGGAAMALLLWMQQPALSGNGALYMETATYGKLLAAAVPAAFLGWWLVKLVKTQRMRSRLTGLAEIEMKGRICRLRAMVDSGNCLYEPMTGRAVVLIDEKGARASGFCAENDPERMVLIPYEAVGVKRGMLQGVRLDRLQFGGREIRSVVLAQYEGNFPGFEVLLHQDILEGGLVNDAENQEERLAGADADAVVSDGSEERTAPGVLHRGKRCVAAAAGAMRGGQAAAGVCGGESGCEEPSHRAESAAGGLHRTEI